ncbi:MAG: hypothetical protein QNK23_11155 [Crocinitomicaceae bacterium]|nr:hypothetical protein [Crocinitomicaceae bacterium]
MRKLLFSVFIILSPLTFGQNPTEAAQPIVEEGKALYRLEMSSWFGTDVFLEHFKDRNKIGGYFSYVVNDDLSKCVFYSRDNTPKIIGTISFGADFNLDEADVDLDVRSMTQNETDLYEIRKITIDLLETDELFKYYENTGMNPIPIINGKEKKVYVLTAPNEAGHIIFGNDYLITFDKKNRVKSKKALHQNILFLEFGAEDVVSSVHSHTNETGHFITATDICTLMLYAKHAGWKSHMVTSKKYTNIWNCETNSLVVIPSGSIQVIIDSEENKTNEQK